jgi:UDP-2-acetamido-3-amino-2,3-dideoxy-glucuronate N-acetyltransferase
MTELPQIKLQTSPGESDVRVEPTGVRGVDLYHFPWIKDPRGDLTVGEFGRGFPFQPKRYFIVFGVSAGTLRGEHAHKACHQFLICAQGRCTALVDDGANSCEVILDNPSVGLYVPPLIWGTQHDYSYDGALLVFASDYYDPDDYIRDYGAFQSALGG